MEKNKVPFDQFSGVDELDDLIWKALIEAVSQHNGVLIEEISGPMKLGPSWREIVKDVAGQFPRRPIQVISAETSVQEVQYWFAKANQASDVVS